MHRCLQILEMVEMVCFQFDPYPSRDVKDLASLARTCTIFQGPALDVLWKVQRTLMNLVRCMPTDLFDVQLHAELFGTRKRLQFRRPILATDWERPLLYAHRVKCFTSYPASFGIFERVELPENIFQALNLCVPSDHIFPNLEVLRWCSIPSDFPYIRLFLAPKITTVDIVCPSSWHLSILSTVGSKYHTLKNISVHIAKDMYTLESEPPVLNDSDISSLSTFVCGLKSAESLSLSALDQKALQHIGRFPTLTVLCLRTLFAFSSPRIPDCVMFAGLRTCDLKYVEVGPTTQLLEMCSRIPLEELSVEFKSCSRTVATDRFYAALAAGCSHSTLASLSLRNDEENLPGVGQNAYMITSNALRTLLCFRNLKSVSITSPFGFDLDDAALSQIARAWPNIESLDLCSIFPGPAAPPRPSITLQCLHSFAQHCPYLKGLTLALNAFIIPPRETRRVFQKELMTLDVGYSPISSSLSVSRFISTIFPNLRYISTSRDGRDDDDDVDIAEIQCHNRWKEVKEQIPVLAEIREEGRLSAQVTEGS
ncbi:hypothetical protein C8J57DRAFT_1732272 [Mycena rebaudengoi]|nr:hypothetical protein C8J57DRAFT_1732272 [Mycena rebaudengoi]